MLHIYIQVFLFNFLQMQLKVRRVTHTILDEAGGSPEEMAKLVANVNSQRVMKPFLPVTKDSPQLRFGMNVLDTLSKAKEHANKAGSAPDLLRRALVVSGAEGPLSKNPVVLFVQVLLTLIILFLVFMYVLLLIYTFHLFHFVVVLCR